MSEHEVEASSEYKNQIQKIMKSRPPPQNPIDLGGLLGTEGSVFLNTPLRVEIETDLKQALHIKNFISNSIRAMKEKFNGRREELLVDM